MPGESEPEYEPGYERMRLLSSYYAIVSSCAVGLLLTAMVIFFVVRDEYHTRFVELVLAQPAATMGVPICSVIALVNVLMLRTIQGPIEIELPGIKFRGASGPIIMWVLCFLALIWAVGHLWGRPGLPQ